MVFSVVFVFHEFTTPFECKVENCTFSEAIGKAIRMHMVDTYDCAKITVEAIS